MNGSYYREKADRCRLRSAIATAPEVKDQLRLWAYEFDEIAEAAEKRNQLQQRSTGRHNRLHRSLRAVTA